MATWHFDPLGLRTDRKHSRADRSEPLRRQRTGHLEPLEQRHLMAVSPTLVAINPNEGAVLMANETRDIAPRELTIRFDAGQIIDPNSLGGIQLVRSGQDGSFGNANDVVITPGFIGIGERSSEVIVRFAEALPDDFYQLTIVGQGATALKNTEGDLFNNGTNVVTPFRLNLGPQVVAVVPQPITRNASGGLQQANNQIVVYFNNDRLDLAAAQNVDLYKLIFTAGTSTNGDDQVFAPTSAVYKPNDNDGDNNDGDNTVTLTFASNLASLGAGPGTYRLRIGDESQQSTTLPNIVDDSIDAGSSIGTSINLGFLTDQTQIRTGGQIFNGPSPTNTPYNLTFPGGNDNPGHRDIPAESHLEGGGDGSPNIPVIAYNFRDVYGTDPQGNTLFNVITETQKQRTREVFELYGRYLGVKFFETPGSGFTIVTGDLRALDPNIPTGPGGVAGLAGGGMAIMDAAENWGESEYGGGWFQVAMHEIGHLLGLGHTYDLPPLTILGSDGSQAVGPPEPVFPGDADIIHGQYLYRPDSKDIDFYRFQLTTAGQFTAETIAERLNTPSTADTVLSLYDEDGVLIARNDDYFSSDSFLDLELDQGVYYIAVSSTGNTDFDPHIVDSGFGGTTEGSYNLRFDFNPKTSSDKLIDATDATIGTPQALDGDFDGRAGGEFNFWFNVGSNNIYVDKLAATTGANGSLARPFNTIAAAFAAATPGTVIRVVGNGGADGNVNTLGDNRAYEIGRNQFEQSLSDGATMDVPKDVTVVIDAGAVFKVRQANLNAGSFAVAVDLSGGALQVLGTPGQKVTFTSYNDQSIGVDTNPLNTTPAPGDWGGLVFRGGTPDLASDQEDQGIFVNYVGQANIAYGGGTVIVDSQPAVYNPIHMVTSRPTAAFNTITQSADAAISADPDSFQESLFHDNVSSSEYRRIGPELHGNRLLDNSINGLFVRIRTQSGIPIDVMNVAGRFNDTDIVHVITENLLVKGTPGGSLNDGTGLQARLDARLAIDPGIIVKLKASRIEVGMSAQLIAEGTVENRVIFTSLADDTFGAGGTFDTTGDDDDTTPAAGDWGGIYFHPVSKGSLDHTLLTFGGGETRIEGSFADFSAIEVHQAEVRIANSMLVQNSDGFSGGSRDDYGSNVPSTIFVRGAQPVIVNNIFQRNAGDAISINVNAHSTRKLGDYGRSTQFVGRFVVFDDNQGPLVRLNRLVDNDINGMSVRGGTLTTEVVLDDTDIVHVVRDAIEVPNLHTYGGMRLQSSPTQSLVVKLAGATAGFTAGGRPLDIDDRIGGTLEVLGTPGHPVILTALSDQTAGAGFDLDGRPQTKTQGGTTTPPTPGSWKGITVKPYSNDRNVDVTVELETPYTGPTETNGTPNTAQFLGLLAPDVKNGDDNRRLGFEVHGSIAFDRSADLDVYSFNGTAGTEVWFDIDRTSVSLDTVIELVSANGQVLARSNDSTAESANPALFTNNPAGNIARKMQRSDAFSGFDLYTTNIKDAGMRLLLPGTLGTTNTYYVRVRSGSPTLGNTGAGQTSGQYRLQIRLREVDEFPGTTVRFADIRYAVNGIEVLGMPGHSYQSGESASSPTILNTTLNSAQDVGNLLNSDRNAIAIASAIASPLDVDWFKFTIDYQNIQAIGGFSDGGKTWATIFDIDYADGLSRPDLILSVFDSLGQLLWVSRDSSVSDDQPNPIGGSSATDLSRGSFGKLDPFLGSVQMPEGSDWLPINPSKTYYVAISSNAALPEQLTATFDGDEGQMLVRLEPVNSIRRIVEDHIGTVGYVDGAGSAILPTKDQGILKIGDATQLRAHVVPFSLGDMVLYVSRANTTWGTLNIVNPLTGAQVANVGQTRVGNEPGRGRTPQDIAMRSDGVLYAAQYLLDDGGNGGRLVIVDQTNAESYLLGEANFPAVPPDGITTEPDQVTSFGSDALAFRRFPAGGTFTETTSEINFTVWDPDESTEHYDLYYAVNDFFSNRSFLFRANPTTGDATHDDDGPFGPVNAAFIEDPEPTLNTPIFDPTGVNTITTVTGMAFVQRQGILLFSTSPSQIVDGQIFSISDSDSTTIFEFDKSGNGVTPGRQAVNVQGLADLFEVTDAIADAIIASGLTIDPRPNSLFGGLELINGFAGAGLNSTVTFDELPDYGQTLYGVDTSGNFFTINAPLGIGFLGFGTAGHVSNVSKLTPTAPFAGLTAAPKNLDINRDNILGDLQDTLFAICQNGDLYAIDTLTGTFRTDIFPGGVDHVSTFLSDVTGLAFSALDTNLWHPTNFMGDDPGHGINLAGDGSRLPIGQKPTETGVSTMGGTSFYFGFETADQGYISYAQQGPSGSRTEGAQYGFLNRDQQFDLTVNSLQDRFGNNDFGVPPPLDDDGGEEELRENTLLDNNYNFPLARGSLVTDSFSLEGYEYTDKPTLYFNYYLEAKFNADTNPDTAKVYISEDNGATWVLLATNDTRRSDDPGQLPRFTSTSSLASSKSNQHVQQLFDAIETSEGVFNPNWRQARIDIGQWAGDANLKLRFEFVASRSDNNHRGFAVDDIIVGFSGRGEMVTRPQPWLTNETTPPISNSAFFAVPEGPLGTPNQVLVGGYQLEIRRGTEYAVSNDGVLPTIALNPAAILDIRDRLSQSITLTAPAGSQILDGQTFVVSDGVNRVTFEFNNFGGVAAGNVAVPFSNLDSDITVAKSIRNAINGRNNSTFRVSASSVLTSDKVDLFDAVDVDRTGTPALVATIVRRLGDPNQYREQGQLILNGNRIESSLNYGIAVDASARDANGSHQAAVRNLTQINTPRLVPGVTITNNLIVGSTVGGILFSGDPSPPDQAPAVVPFGRIINNTIVGNGTNVGVQVGENAGPTLLNNILSNLLVGVFVDPTSVVNTVIGSSLFHLVPLLSRIVNDSGSETIALADNEPLFVNSAGGNFNLAAGSKAIDSAINSLNDRPEMTTINNPVGIGPSQILAPNTDLTGKVRVDDPLALPPPGIGGSVFKDRGALDRSDFVGPEAVLVVPQDNDTLGVDLNPEENKVIPVGAVLSFFSMQLIDGTGTGIDPLTVTSGKFVLKRNGVTLVDGVDYVFGYDQTNQIIRFTPVEGVWITDSEYIITLDNSAATGIKDLGGNPLRPNETTGVTEFSIFLKSLDFGDAPDPTYPTLAASNGAVHIIQPAMFLGAGIDEDIDGRPTPEAGGDDGDKFDDGVVFNTPLIPGVQSTITITASAAGFIDAFIDLNGDGDWNDANEKFLSSRAVIAGANTINVTLPAATAITTFARFRYSSAGGLGPTGIGNDGEVEDYQVTIPASVAYTVRLINPATNKEILKDAQGRYVVLANAEFEARVYVDDTRPTGAAGGVFAAFADLVASQPLINWNAASLLVDPEFSAAGLSGSVDASLGVNEAGGIADASPSGADTRRQLFKVRGTVLPAATPGTTFQLQLNAADLLPAHNTLVYGLNGAIGASYQSIDVIVPTNPWQNPFPGQIVTREGRQFALDVFPDGFISAFDALLIINELNKPGFDPVLPAIPVPPNIPPPYLDVDGNGLLTAADVLAVIRELNDPLLPEPYATFPTESEPVPSAAAPAAAVASSLPLASEPILAVSSAIDLVPLTSPEPAAASSDLADLALAVYDNLDAPEADLDLGQLATQAQVEAVESVLSENVPAGAASQPVGSRHAVLGRPVSIASAAARLAAFNLFAADSAGDQVSELDPAEIALACQEVGSSGRRRKGARAL